MILIPLDCLVFPSFFIPLKLPWSKRLYVSSTHNLFISVEESRQVGILYMISIATFHFREIDIRQYFQRLLVNNSLYILFRQ